MTSDRMRASDRDRDAVAATLREACAVGRLTLAEFTERMEQAFTSKTWGELRALTGDLPEQPRLGADLPHPHPHPHPVTPAPHPHPATAPAWNTTGNVSRRRPVRFRNRVSPVPFVVTWLLIVLVTRSAASIAVPVVVLALVLLLTALSRRN